MNLAQIFRGVLRRWYITVPGLILAGALATAAWLVIPVSYERSATQVLLPGKASMPDNSNPYLYLGGLQYTADIVVRALGSENMISAVTDQHPAAKITVERDLSSSGPVIVITATADTDKLAGELVNQFAGKTASVLDDLQSEEKIPANNRISVITLTIDEKGTVQPRNRLIATAIVGAVGVLLSLLLAGAVDGLVRQRRRRASDDGEEAPELDEIAPSEEKEDEEEEEEEEDGAEELAVPAATASVKRRAPARSVASADRS